jgi:hypothetical protein
MKEKLRLAAAAQALAEIQAVQNEPKPSRGGAPVESRDPDPKSPVSGPLMPA